MSDQFDESKIKRDERGRFARKGGLKKLAQAKAAQVEQKASKLRVESDPVKIAAGMDKWADHFETEYKATLEYSFERGLKRSMEFSLKRLEQEKGDKVLTAFLTIPEARKQGLARNLPVEVAKKIIKEEIDKAGPKLEEMRKKIGFSDQEIELIRDSSHIASSLEASLGDSRARKRMMGVFDEDGNLQAVMLHKSEAKNLYVELLATAPWNIAGNDGRRMKGAGTKAITEVVKLSREKGKKGQVKLTPLRNAIPFYEKMGFVMTPGGDMKLSEEAAKRYE